MKETNIDRCRDMAKCFLRLELAETSVPFVCSHPFTNSWSSFFDNRVLDLHKKEDYDCWIDMMDNLINESDLMGLFSLLNTPYILTFLKYVKIYLSKDDIGKVLQRFWQQQEQISLDCNVTGKEVIALFKKATPTCLMNEEMLNLYNSLPDSVTVYRGVTSHNKQNKKALSWTLDRNIADWFAKRFNTGTGEVWTITVPKKRILCLFEGDEKEVIVNLYGWEDPISIDPVLSC